MPEDAGKKQEINDFLQRFREGRGFDPDLWLDRLVESPDTLSDTPKNSASSAIGVPVNNLSELIRQDIDYCFGKGNFLCRMIQAQPGSGKTATLGYTDFLLEDWNFRSHTNQTRRIIRLRLNLNALTNTPNQGEDLRVRLYLYCLSESIIHALCSASDVILQQATIDWLSEVLTDTELSAITGATKAKKRAIKDTLKGLGEDLSLLFLNFLASIVNKNYAFFLSLDEMDALTKEEEIRKALNAIRHFLNLISEQYKNKIPLLFYFSGLSDELGEVLMSEEALKTRLLRHTIRLVRFTAAECEAIKTAVETMLEEAYSGYKDFDVFWQELREIEISKKAYTSLRTFCALYGQRVLEIHNRYFKHHDKDFNVFESKARERLKQLCWDLWKKYLGSGVSAQRNPGMRMYGHDRWEEVRGKSGYSLIVAKTTSVIGNHHFDAYGELHHNGQCIARAYGEAKNYRLMTSHLETFQQWLDDVGANLNRPDGEISDMACFFSTACSPLMKMKVSQSRIQSEILPKQVVNCVKDSVVPEKTESFVGFVSQNKEGSSDSSDVKDKEMSEIQWMAKEKVISEVPTGVNLNAATFDELVEAVKGTGLKKTTLKKLIGNRPYWTLDELMECIRTTEKVRGKLQNKLDAKDIYFGYESEEG